MRRLIICTAIIVCGIEFGGMGYDSLQKSITADISQMQKVRLK
jgi:hypothetical protein